MKTYTYLLALPLLTFGLLLSGCDSGGSNQPSVEGIWIEQEADATPLYVEITSDAYIEYETYDVGDCYSTQVNEIVEQDGNVYIFASGESIRAVVEEGVLTITYLQPDGEPGETARYVPANDLPATCS